MNKYIIAIILLVSAFLISCYEDEPEYVTRLVEREDLNLTPGLTWFQAKVESYNCEPDILVQLKSGYNKDKHHFIFFASPSCSCDSLQLASPYIMRVLDQIGVDSLNYEFYVMENETKDHPYKEIITLKRMPSIFLKINGIPVYSINDTMQLNPNGRSFEQIVLDAINMYQ